MTRHWWPKALMRQAAEAERAAAAPHVEEVVEAEPLAALAWALQLLYVALLQQRAVPVGGVGPRAVAVEVAVASPVEQLFVDLALLGRRSWRVVVPADGLAVPPAGRPKGLSDSDHS